MRSDEDKWEIGQADIDQQTICCKLEIYVKLANNYIKQLAICVQRISRGSHL